MKKVGIVSCYFKDNYGSMLQAYATKKILDNNNIPNETINISSNIDFKKGKLKYYITQIFNFSFIKTKFGMIKFKFDKIFNKELKKNVAIRTNKYKEFRKEFNMSIPTTTYEDLTKLAKVNYSDVVLGSDQLWLPVNVVADYYTLNWVPDNINKISYSTSFGVSAVPKKYTELYKSFLKRINHLSVREDTGVKLVKSLSDKKAELVCDPTLLLTKKEWEIIASKERKYNEKYILCYFLGSNIEHRKFAQRLKEKTGYKIVSLNHADEYVKYSDKFCDYSPYDIGPKEWISLIKHAEYVCTDSFHGTVFSLLYNKIFFDFRRYNSKVKGSTNSRLDSLLKIAGVSSERILSGTENIDEVLKYKIDYNKVNRNIDTFRKESKEWLLGAITYKDEKDIKYIEINDKEMCAGCTACKNKCPKNAISMEEDKEGFLYPKVDKTKCINCSICKKVCPILNKKNMDSFEQKAYVFQNKKDEVRNDSTSGGFFSAIGEYVLAKDGIVYGAAFTDDFIVEHQRVTNKSELYKFRKSKYVQSNLNDIFKNVEHDLKNKKLVCFSGTPCQVAGLNSFLGKKYNNLILIDIMCHSVPSPLFYEKYKKHILKKMKADKIININFRDKSKYGYKYSMMTVETDNGKYSQGIDTDPYLRAFFGDLSVRPSCYNCQFKTQQRVSDITIWDCFNISDIEKSFDDDKGTTRILIQTQKGMDIINKLRNVRMKEIDINIAVNKVREMTYSVKYNSKRDDFFDEINDENLFNKYFPINFKTKINSYIRKFLSVTGMYSFIKKNIKKIINK